MKSDVTLSRIHYNRYWPLQVAYTFDAGPNACLYALEEDVPRVMSFLQHFFPPAKDTGSTRVTGLPVETVAASQVHAIQLVYTSYLMFTIYSIITIWMN